MVEFFWSYETIHEGASFKVLSLAEPHCKDILLTSDSQDQKYETILATNQSLSTTS